MNKQIIPKDFQKVIDEVRAAMDTCPWNPFPVDSPWGERIEDQYQRHKRAKQRTQMRLARRHGHK